MTSFFRVEAREMQRHCVRKAARLITDECRLEGCQFGEEARPEVVTPLRSRDRIARREDFILYRGITGRRIDEGCAGVW